MTPDEIQMILGDLDKAEDGNDYLNIIENYEMRLREVLTQALEIANGNMVLVPRELLDNWISYSYLNDECAHEEYPDIREKTREIIEAYEEGK